MGEDGVNENQNVNSPQADFDPNVALTDPSEKFLSKSLIASIFSKVAMPHPHTHANSHAIKLEYREPHTSLCLTGKLLPR